MARNPARPPCTYTACIVQCKVLPFCVAPPCTGAEPLKHGPRGTRVAGPQSLPPAPGESQSQVPLLPKTPQTLTLEGSQRPRPRRDLVPLPQVLELHLKFKLGAGGWEERNTGAPCSNLEPKWPRGDVLQSALSQCPSLPPDGPFLALVVIRLTA